MEATGVYWKPVWAILEDRFACILVNARHVKQVPGRKTDVTDAQWLCRLAEAGLLRASLVPPRPIRALRNLTRYRKAEIRDRQREAGRLHKLLEDTGIKLDCVASDLLGKSGRAMLAALIDGTTDPERARRPRAREAARSSCPALREALQGRFDAQHAIIIGRILAHIDYLDEAITELSTAIEEQIAPFASAVELLCTIPGVQRRTAEVIIAETGGDMNAFPTAKHLASWAGICPGNDQSLHAAPAPHARAPNGCARTSSNRPRPPAGPKTPTSPRNTSGSAPAAATPKPPLPSRTRSLSPPGTCFGESHSRRKSQRSASLIHRRRSVLGGRSGARG